MLNLSTKKVELEIPMEEIWNDWNDIEGLRYECIGALLKGDTKGFEKEE